MTLSAFDLQHAPCGIFSFGDDLRLTEANQTLADMLQVPASELAGKPLDQLLNPSIRLMFHMQVIPRLYVHRYLHKCQS